MKHISNDDLAKYLYRLNGYGDLGPEILDLTHEAADRLLQFEILKKEYDALKKEALIMWDLI